MPTNFPQYDVLIIGGGPAGLSAALWCSDLGLRAVILEKEPVFGGQLLRTYNRIGNYIGIEDATGVEIRDRFLKQVEKGTVERRVGSVVSRVDLAGKSVELDDGTHLTGKAIIIATGVRRRKLGIAGEQKFEGRGILDSGVRNRENVAGKVVLIVGGGDAALENATILGETAKHVTVVHRRGRFTARPDFIEAASRMPNVSFMLNTVVQSIAGNDKIEGSELKSTQTSDITQLEIDAMLIRIGVVANTELFQSQLALGPNGYIKIDANCRANIDGIYATGDVACPLAPTISSAVGMGATAVKNIELAVKGNA